MLWCLLFLARIECYLKLEPVVFSQARARSATSRSALIRPLVGELEVHYAFRNLELERLPQIGSELEANLLASKIRREKGLEGFEGAGRELPGVGSTDQSRSIVPTLLTHALIATLAGSRAPSELIERWRENALGLAGYDWLNDWLHFAKQIFIVSTAEAVAMMGDAKLAGDMRLLAATRLMSDLDSGVERVFNAQVWLVIWLGQSRMRWSHDVANHFAPYLAGAWKKQCAFKAALRTPGLTVPEIERECDSKEEGIVKAAKILLAAANAVNIPLSVETRRQLQALGSTEMVNPYRFA